MTENRGSGIDAFRKRVHTDWRSNFVNVGAPPDNPTAVEWLIHNHPGTGLSIAEQNFMSYPSKDDVDRFQQLVVDRKFSSSASLFIVDPSGNTREFPASSLTGIQSLSDAAKKTGEGLPPPLVSTGTCRDLQ